MINKYFGLLLLCCIASQGKAQIIKNKRPPTHVDAQPLKNIRSREVSVELPCNPDATIFIEDLLRGVNIRTTRENKVRLVTMVFYQGDTAATNEEWLQRLKVRLR